MSLNDKSIEGVLTKYLAKDMPVENLNCVNHEPEAKMRMTTGKTHPL